jgi:hypothetical protein
MRRIRQLRGSKSRAEYEATSLSRTKPWLALGIGRRQWERRRKATNGSGGADQPERQNETHHARHSGGGRYPRL